MEENPTDQPAQDDTTPITGTAEDGGLMVLVTDSFGETGGGGDTDPDDGNG